MEIGWGWATTEGGQSGVGAAGVSRGFRLKLCRLMYYVSG